METTTIQLVKTTTTASPEHLTYNECVHRAYRLMHLWATAALSMIEDGILIREDPLLVKEGNIIHELISPLLYLRLECYEGNQYGIRFDYEPNPSYARYYPIMAAFVRMLYKLTGKKASQVNIEEAVHIHHIQTDCSDLFDYLQEVASRYHHFEVIAYKSSPVKRKLHKVA